MINLFNYIEHPSPIHRLTGACKLVALIAWSVAAMTSFHTPLLIALTPASFLLFKVAKQKLKDISFVFCLMGTYIVLNNVLIYLFSPIHGTGIYDSYTLLFKIAGPYVLTAERLFSHLNVILKREYRDISLAQQARGTKTNKKASLVKRLKAASTILIPLILPSMERIETITNSMELRGFGKGKK